ncbi:Putative protein phosphatase [Sarcoptes scabiei]|uniref:protein-serine/threonine phosphatase n=1 Tax=Sarcoptes scabiei TaxID=52283 RepID=A0A834R4A8_SARSC|nr:Putative protein phosphatase [Sarcoptes scabiei]
MGPYLSKPKTQITTSYDQGSHFKYCTAEMQGWRKTQEDAHVARLHFDGEDTAFFGVFDGHGGEEVSRYCALYLPDFIRDCSLYKENKISEAIEECFLRFDRKLLEPDVQAELAKIGCIDDPDDIDENETIDLKKEASMSLAQIIGKNLEYLKNNVNDAEKDGQINGENHINMEEDHNDDKSTENKDESEQSSPPSKGEKKHLINETLRAFLSDYSYSDDDEEDDEDEEIENNDDDDDDDEDIDEGINSSSESDDSEDENDDADDEEIGDNKFFQSLSPANRGPAKESGSTAIVAIIRANTVYVGNIGDSRCVISRNGKAIDLSQDHKPEDKIEKDRILNAGAEIIDGRVNGGLNLSRAFGDHIYKTKEDLSDREQMIVALPDIETFEIDWDSDQFLFLACDGIWNSMNSQEVVDFINERLRDDKSLKEICEELFKACLAPNTNGDGSGCDNMTCILIQLHKEKLPNIKRTLDADGVDDHDSDGENLSKFKKSKISKEEEDLFKPGPSTSSG